MVPLTAYTPDDQWGAQLVAPYDRERSVVILKDDQMRGVIGEFGEQVKKAFKLPKFAAGFEVRLDMVQPPSKEYRPLSRYPGTSQDISIKVKENVVYGEIIATVRAALDRLDPSFASSLEPISIYKAEAAIDKTFTFRVSLVNHDRTLTDDEINEVMRSISIACVEEYQATIV